MAQTYTGTSGADEFTAPDVDIWTIIGRGGNDILIGSILSDIFYGGFGNDTLDGGDGDDSFLVGRREGVDSYAGGNGIDRIAATDSNVVIGIAALSGVEEISSGGFDNVSIAGSTNADILDFSNVLLTGIVSIGGGAGDDLLTSTAFADVVNGGSGTDTISTLGGDDRIVVGFNAGFDSIDGGDGSDVIEAAADGVTMLLGSFTGIEEISSGGFGEVRVRMGSGDDVIDLTDIVLTDIVEFSGGNGNDTITGGAADEILSGGNGDDIIRGGAGNDTLNGGGGLDTLEGGTGDDLFLIGAGGAGKDSLRGGAGFDTIQGTADFAKLILDGSNMTGIEYVNSGGFANFTIEASAGGASFNLSGVQLDEGDVAAINGSFAADDITGSKVADTINGGSGSDRLSGGTGDDIVGGDDGDDFIDGGAGADALLGGDGNDTLLGQGGIDDIDGGLGNDIISGGSGTDTLRGGDGGDIFRDRAVDLAGDTIGDFAVGDRISIQNFVFGGASSAVFADGNLRIDADGAGGVAAINIRLDGVFTNNFSVAADPLGGLSVVYNG